MAAPRSHDLLLAEGQFLARRHQNLPLIKSMPVTISVTGCSTWMRAFISMKKNLPVRSTINSTVPALVYLAARTSRTAASHIAVRVFRIQLRSGALFHQLLVPPLHRAVALPKVDHVAVMVGQHLDLDVAGMLDVFSK